MEWFRWQQNPWGQKLLRGLDWDVTWIAIGLGGLCIVVHMLLYVWRWRPVTSGQTAITARSPEVIDTGLRPHPLPERVLRHSLVSRLFHWSMAASVIALLLTGFLPIMGLKFSWVAPHWMVGVALTGVILFHIIHATFWKGLGWMWITRQDWRQGWLILQQLIEQSGPLSDKPGKNPLENKLFHHITGLATLATIVTGLLMMIRVDTPFWTRNPYLLPDGTWGVIYVVHGAASVALITLIMVHVYFAIRPEKRWLTRSMFTGWISLDRYLEHYDPVRWPVEKR